MITGKQLFTRMTTDNHSRQAVKAIGCRRWNTKILAGPWWLYSTEHLLQNVSNEYFYQVKCKYHKI